MVKYIELPSRMFCPVHKCYFSKGKSCALCDSHPLIADGNVKTENTPIYDFTNNSRTITNNSRRVYVKRQITERFHSYRKKFIAEVNWDALFKYDEFTLKNNVKFKRINFEDAIVRVFRKSILVTIRSSKEVKGLNVKEAQIRSDDIIKNVLSLLPSAIKVKNIGNVSSVHNAFINHPFASKNVKVKVNDEVRFISDNSKGKPEFEAVNTEFAISDSEHIERDMVSLIDKGLSRDFLASALNDLIKDRYFHAENMRSHVQAIQELSKGVNEFRSSFSSLNCLQEVRSINSPPLSLPPVCISKYDDDSIIQSKLKTFKQYKARELLKKCGW
jgi:hypothetical protein